MRKPTRSAPSPFPIAVPDEELLRAARSFGPEGEPETVAGRPHLIKFDDTHGNWLIRRLPFIQPVERIVARHQFMNFAAERLPYALPVAHPVKSAGTIGEATYEVVRYLPGASWAANGRLMWEGHGLMRPMPPPQGGMAAVAELVASIHLGEEDKPAGSLPMVNLRDYLSSQRVEWKAVSDYISKSGRREVHINRWQSASQRVVFAAWDVLEDSGFLEPRAGVPSHHNLWPAHVITNNGKLSLVDWGKACFASPLIDVAQLVARFNGWSASALEEVIESYMGVRTLTADERRLMPVFGALDLAVETGKLLAEAYVADLDQTSQYAEMARSGAGAMLGSLESIGWSIRKTNIDSKELRRDARDRARSAREPGQKPRPRQLTSKRPKQ